MIAKLERTQSTAKQNQDLTLNPNKKWEQQQTMNKQQQNYRLRTDSSRIHWGKGVALFNFTGQTFTLDSAAVKTQD